MAADGGVKDLDAATEVAAQSAPPPPPPPRPAHHSQRVGPYLLGRTIGEGSYAKVRYGQHAESGRAVAVKVLDKAALLAGGLAEQVRREVEILRRLRHPNVVQLLEVLTSSERVFLVMELVAGGERRSSRRVD